MPRLASDRRRSRPRERSPRGLPRPATRRCLSSLFASSDQTYLSPQVGVPGDSGLGRSPASRIADRPHPRRTGRSPCTAAAARRAHRTSSTPSTAQATASVSTHRLVPSCSAHPLRYSSSSYSIRSPSQPLHASPRRAHTPTNTTSVWRLYIACCGSPQSVGVGEYLINVVDGQTRLLLVLIEDAKVLLLPAEPETADRPTLGVVKDDETRPF